jgi:hypothetical protein
MYAWCSLNVKTKYLIKKILNVLSHYKHYIIIEQALFICTSLYTRLAVLDCDMQRHLETNDNSPLSPIALVTGAPAYGAMNKEQKLILSSFKFLHISLIYLYWL